MTLKCYLYQLSRGDFAFCCLVLIFLCPCLDNEQNAQTAQNLFLLGEPDSWSAMPPKRCMTSQWVNNLLTNITSSEILRAVWSSCENLLTTTLARPDLTQVGIHSLPLAEAGNSPLSKGACSELELPRPEGTPILIHPSWDLELLLWLCFRFPSGRMMPSLLWTLSYGADPEVVSTLTVVTNWSHHGEVVLRQRSVKRPRNTLFSKTLIL